MKRFLYTLGLALLMCFGLLSCKKGINNPLQVGSVGTAWEILVVMDKAQWQAPEGQVLREVLDADLPGLPRSEPYFKISRCDVKEFTGILKPVRNIIQVEISNIYSAPKFHYYKDLWASNQAVLKIVAPDAQQFMSYLIENDQQIYDYFEDVEMKRSLHYIQKSYQRSLSEAVKDSYDIEILVPELMKAHHFGENFFWASNRTNKKRQDLVIYSYPYTDVNTFTLEYLNHKRDSVMAANIPGGPDGSYMGRQETAGEYYRPMNVNGKYAALVRGLWEVKGDVMGGPYVSLTRIDEINNRVVTAEVFVYAPEDDKRNVLRHNEAILYSMKLPGESEEE